jgi:hypothetical protein
MMTFRKISFLVAALLLFANYLPAANTILVYGPTVFTVPSGPPAAETVSFPLPQRVYSPFTLLVSPKDVTGVNLELNGATIFGSEAFGSQPLRAVVPLNADNTLKVELTGQAGASVTIIITGYEYEYASSYQDLPVAAAVNSSDPLPSSIDWRTKGAVGPVQNQGDCDSGWAFSATGAVEGVVAIDTGTLPSLSEQQLIDCSGFTGNHGCNGGSPAYAFKYITQNGGLASESAYPYTARDGSCKRATAVAKISGFVELPYQDETALAAEVAQQPVSVVVHASGGFQSYRSGVFSGPCGEAPDQPVLVVGYTPTYWIVKNSRGVKWGMNGYILMARGKNLCGIADYAVVPTGGSR